MFWKLFLSPFIFFISILLAACSTTAKHHSENNFFNQSNVVDQAKYILDQQIASCLTDRLALSQKSELSVNYIYKNNRLRINSGDPKLDQYMQKCVALVAGPSITVQGKISVSRQTGISL